MVVGHRGEPRGTPENTLPSIARALDLGAGMGRAHGHGLLVYVYAYTVNDEPTMRRLIGLGVDAVETDELALLLRVVRDIAGGR